MERTRTHLQTHVRAQIRWSRRARNSFRSPCATSWAELWFRLCGAQRLPRAGSSSSWRGRTDPRLVCSQNMKGNPPDLVVSRLFEQVSLLGFHIFRKVILRSTITHDEPTGNTCSSNTHTHTCSDWKSQSRPRLKVRASSCAPSSF